MAVDQGPVYLPVALKFWEGAELIKHSVKDAGGADLESLEIPNTKGQTVFAIEDGDVSVRPDAQEIALANLSDENGYRYWIFKNVRPLVSDGSRVKAGDKIGVVSGGNLNFWVLDEDSPQTTISSQDAIKQDWPWSLIWDDIPASVNTLLLPSDPMPRLDDLDALPLPGDVPVGDVDTALERRRLSERLTGGSSIGLKEVAIGAGVAVGGVLLLRAIFK